MDYPYAPAKCCPGFNARVSWFPLLVYSAVSVNSPLPVYCLPRSQDSAFRLNGDHQDHCSPDAGNSKSFLVAGCLTYQCLITIRRMYPARLILLEWFGVFLKDQNRCTAGCVMRHELHANSSELNR